MVRDEFYNALWPMPNADSNIDRCARERGRAKATLDEPATKLLSSRPFPVPNSAELGPFEGPLLLFVPWSERATASIKSSKTFT